MHKLGLESESKVGVWTEKQFIPLLTASRVPKGLMKLKKQIKLLSFCSKKIDPKLGAIFTFGCKKALPQDQFLLVNDIYALKIGKHLQANHQAIC